MRGAPSTPVLAAGLLLIGVLALGATGAAAQAVHDAPDTEPDSTLEALAWLAGSWGVPGDDPVLAERPDLAEVAIVEVGWVVGGKALRWREHVRRDGTAELEGMIYWDPAEERIGLLAVAGSGEGQGRLFRGTFMLLADGRLEKVYDVFYRTLADTPGEDLGGSRRRFREIWERAGEGRLVHTLEWWHEGRWQPYAGSRYTLARREASMR